MTASSKHISPSSATGQGKSKRSAPENRKRLDLLLTLALLHLGHGQPQRGLTYAMLANTFSPADHAARRILAFGLYRNGAQSEALDAIDSLRRELAPRRDKVLELMRAECLKARGNDGDDEAAKDAFWRAISISAAKSVINVRGA
jgi:hypothetical protein